MSDTSADLFERVAIARREWMACFDAITDWVFVKAGDLRIIKANRAAAALFSRLPQQLIGHTCQSLFGSKTTPTDEALVERTFRTGLPESADVSDLPVPGEFHISTYPLRDDSGAVVAVVEVVREVGEQKAMQRQVLQSARLAAVGELAAGVAHNFGNILMGVGGSLEVMLLKAETEGLSPWAVERIQMMHTELMRGDTIVRRLLSFARGSVPTIRAVAPGEVLDGVVTLCQAHPLSGGILVAWQVAPGTPAMQADASQLREVLTNLVLNALQATPTDGRVLLSATTSSGITAAPCSPGTPRLVLGAPMPPGECVLLTVDDTGRGIAEEDLPRIFTPFFSRRTDGSQGTGLGLSVSLSMIESMGGRMAVESCLGKGTRFAIALPAADSGPA